MEAERQTPRGWHSPLELPGLNWPWRRPENLNPDEHHSLRDGGAEGPEEHLRTIRGMSKTGKVFSTAGMSGDNH